MLHFEQYKTLTFDCYGTLIDWESGVLSALKPILSEHQVQLEDEQILQQFAELESTEEQQGEYKSYRNVLRGVVKRLGDRFHFSTDDETCDRLPNSIQHWQPFPDTIAALQELKKHYKLVVISNVDDDLFSATAQHLQVPFDDLITAQQVKSYKPSLNNFQVAFQRLNLPIDQILHVAASLHHDIAPAKSLGLDAVWVNRRMGMTGSGAVLEAIAHPDITVPDLNTLVQMISK